MSYLAYRETKLDKNSTDTVRHYRWDSKNAAESATGTHLMQFRYLLTLVIHHCHITISYIRSSPLLLIGLTTEAVLNRSAVCRYLSHKDHAHCLHGPGEHCNPLPS